MNSGHRVNVVRIKEILPHPNADTLALTMIGGYQVVIKKENYKVGDLAVYIQPDSIVPQGKPFEFLWADKEFPDGVVPERYRRITVRRFRKEWSEGLLLPVTDFDALLQTIWNVEGDIPIGIEPSVKEGDDVAELLGITHYEEPEPIENIHGKKEKQEEGWPRSLKGWWYRILRLLGLRKKPLEGANEKAPTNAPPVYDVENYKYFDRSLNIGEEVIVTEKIHGSNARYMFDGKRMWVGSKRLWKSEKSSCIWRRALKELPWIETFCRTYPNCTLYAEIVPTQSGYDYGTSQGTAANKPVLVYGFDVYDPSLNNYLGGYWNKGQTLRTLSLFEGALIVPELYNGPFDPEKIKPLVDGNTTVPNAKHIREGIVISTAEERHTAGLGRVQLKWKSLKFFEKEGRVVA